MPYDLVYELRNPVGLVTANIRELNNEAADEIERLRAALEIAKTALKNIELKSDEARRALVPIVNEQ